jgi:hypothetical protein
MAYLLRLSKFKVCQSKKMNPSISQLTSKGNYHEHSASYRVFKTMKKLIKENIIPKITPLFLITITSIFSSHADNMSKKHRCLYQEPDPEEATRSMGGAINESLFTNQK